MPNNLINIANLSTTYKIDDYGNCYGEAPISKRIIQNKLNEVICAVNEISMRLEELEKNENQR